MGRRGKRVVGKGSSGVLGRRGNGVMEWWGDDSSNALLAVVLLLPRRWQWGLARRFNAGYLQPTSGPEWAFFRRLFREAVDFRYGSVTRRLHSAADSLWSFSNRSIMKWSSGSEK
jgi:hypothetical protein